MEPAGPIATFETVIVPPFVLLNVSVTVSFLARLTVFVVPDRPPFVLVVVPSGVTPGLSMRLKPTLVKNQPVGRPVE